MNKTITAILLFSISIFAQVTEPENLISLVKNNFQTISDYSVDVRVNVDITMLKAPTTQARVYFKQPNKIKIESDGFALIPKQGLNFFPSEILESDYTPIYIRSDKIEGFDVEVIKIIPMSDTTDIILTTIWIDPLIKVIRKIEMNTKSIGLIKIELRYADKLERVLPSEAVFTFQAGEEENSDENNEKKSENRLSNKNLSGKVTLTYTNYLVNSGIDDTFFEQDNN